MDDRREIRARALRLRWESIRRTAYRREKEGQCCYQERKQIEEGGCRIRSYGSAQRSTRFCKQCSCWRKRFAACTRARRIRYRVSLPAQPLIRIANSAQRLHTSSRECLRRSRSNEIAMRSSRGSTSISWMPSIPTARNVSSLRTYSKSRVTRASRQKWLKVTESLLRCGVWEAKGSWRLR